MAATSGVTVSLQPEGPRPVAAAPLRRLTRKERQLYETLLHNAGHCVSRETLLTSIWGYGEGVKSRTVDVHIQRLRRKLPPEAAGAIKTIVRSGYCWLPQASAPAAD